MGFLGGLFGGGANYNAAQGLPGFMAGSNVAGVQGAQQGTQNSIAQQQAFVNALGGNGLNGTQAGILGQQQALANQYGQLAAGQGPNPAQAQLAQNTGQNIQQQAALMGGARGAQSNPGLIARQAAQVGGGLQQQAVGQAATLGAQQQLAGMQGLAAQQGQMANLATAGVGQQQTALSQLGQQNLGYQQQLQNALTAQNAQQVQAQGAQAGLAGQSIAGGQGLFGGLLGGVAAGLLLADGGQVPDSPTSIQQKTSDTLSKSILGQHANGELDSEPVSFNGGAQSVYQGANALGNVLGSGLASALKPTPLAATTPTPLGSSDLNPASFAQYAAKGGQMQNPPKQPPQQPPPPPTQGWANTLGPTLASSFDKYKASKSDGGSVGGEAKVKGDSTKNDTVPAMLSPGEIVIPRSHVDDPAKAAEFLNRLKGWKLRTA